MLQVGATGIEEEKEEEEDDTESHSNRCGKTCHSKVNYEICLNL
jgi:hypothetical protein